MKKLFALAFGMLLLGAGALAQTTSVTATVTDSDGTIWKNGTWSVDFVANPANPYGTYYFNGSIIPPSMIHQSGSIDSSGALSFIVDQNASITPVGSSWNLKVCPDAITQCGIFNFTAIGASMDLSAFLTTAIPAPRFHPVSGAYGYADIEASLQLLPGSTYWNVSSSVQRCYSGAAWSVCNSGNGTNTPSPQFQVPYYLGPGTSAIIKGDSGFTTDGSGNVTMKSGTFSPSAVTLFPSVSGDAGAAINTAFADNNVVVISTATSPVASTTITIPNATTGVNGIAGTLRILGSGTFTVTQIIFQDSTTSSVPSGFIDCPDGATIKLANTSNKDLISDTNFATLTGGTSWYGAFQARINGCILDGNKANNTTGWDVQLYGRAMRFTRMKITNGPQGGLWTELNHAGTGFTSPSDDFETKIIEMQAMFNGGDGLYIHSGDTTVANTTTYMNSTWGIVSAYNGVHVHGVNSYGNTAGGCWAETTGGFFGDDMQCDAYTSGYGLLEDSGAAPMNLANSNASGPTAMEIHQPGNVFQGTIGAGSTAGIKFVNGSGNFNISVVPITPPPPVGYWFDFTGGEAGSSTIIASQNTNVGTGLFNGTPLATDFIAIGLPNPSGATYFQAGSTGTIYVNGMAMSFPATGAATLPATNQSIPWTAQQLFSPASGAGVPSTDSLLKFAPKTGDYAGVYVEGRYHTDFYYGIDSITDDFVVLGNGVPVSTTPLFRIGTSSSSVGGLGSGTFSGTISGPSFAINGDNAITAGPRAFIQADTGNLTSIVASGQYNPVKAVKAGTIENIVATASAFTCTGNPTITLEDCGTSAGACASPTALGSATVTAANTSVDGTITSATITAGHYLVWETTAGTCTTLNLSASAEYRMN